MLNQCNFICRLGKDPSDRRTQSGVQVVTFSGAVTEKVKGEDKTQWVNFTSFNEHLNKFILQYARKGDLCYVSGKLQTRKYEKDGVEKVAVDIVLGYEGKFDKLNWEKKSEGGDFHSRGSSYGSNSETLDGEIPF